jgi:hypothetical protein
VIERQPTDKGVTLPDLHPLPHGSDIREEVSVGKGNSLGGTGTAGGILKKRYRIGSHDWE